jgi:hypothetical protein
MAIGLLGIVPGSYLNLRFASFSTVYVAAVTVRVTSGFAAVVSVTLHYELTEIERLDQQFH